MNEFTGRTSTRGPATVGSLLRGAGRVAIWTVLALLLLRGVVAGLSEQPQTPPPTSASGIDPQSAAFAVQFARAYFTPAEVAQAEVSQSEELGDGKAILTVACELRDSRVLYLAVPIARTDAGEVAALGAPSLVAAPGMAGAAPERPQPLAGQDADAIQGLIERFLPAYVAAAGPDELTYFVAPGSEVEPLGGGFELKSVSAAKQLGSREGPRREVLAGARIVDPTSGATYSVVYRLSLAKGVRWYVQAVEGAVA